MKNSLVVYFGEANKTQGVSAAIGTALQGIANNLDLLIPAIAAIGTALAVGYIVRMGEAAIATKNLGQVILTAFGGPVGLAITALTLTIGAFAIGANAAAARVRETDESFADFKERLDATRQATEGARGGVAGVGNDATTATPKVKAFAGAVGDLADQLYRQAAAAKAARIQQLQTEISEGTKKEQALFKDTREYRNTAQGNGDPLDLLNNIPIVLGKFLSGTRNVLSNGRTDREADRAYREQVTMNLTRRGDLAREMAAPVNAGDLPGGGRAAENPNAKRIAQVQAEIAGLEDAKKTASGAELATIEKTLARRQRTLQLLEAGVNSRAATTAGNAVGSGPSAETLARRRQAAADRAQALADKEVRDKEAAVKAVQDAMLADLREREKITGDSTEIEQLQRQQIEQERVKANQAVAAKGPRKADGSGGDGSFNQATVDQVTALNNDTAQLRNQAITNEQTSRAMREALDVQTVRLGVERDQLESARATARTAKDRRDFETKILENEVAVQRATLTETANDPTKNAKDRAKAREQLAALPARQAAQQKVIDDTNLGPGASYAASLPRTANQIGEAFENAAVGGLKAFEDKLSSSIDKVLHLHGLVGQLLSDIIKIGLERAIIAPIADGLFGKAGGAGGGLLGSVIGSLFGGAHATGGPVQPGKFYQVNEHGTEGFASFREPGRVIPIGETKTSQGASVRGGDITVHVDAKGAQSPEQVRTIATRAIYEAAPIIIEASRTATFTTLKTPTLPMGQG